MSKTQPIPLPSVETLLFKAPLYASYTLNDDLADVRILYGNAEDEDGEHVETKFDAFCPFCKKDTTFTVKPIHIPSGDPWTKIKQRYSFDSMRVQCARHEHHVIRWYFLVRSMTIQKIGQHPSLADIAIDEMREKYRSVLRGENWSELYKAVGLAAHGEGIGSFVYLRRVFERLIQSRFDEFKADEGWKDEDFQNLHMDQKIAFLKDHLPPYLVEIRKIYSIFSKGIHELDNEACLDFFDVGKRSIIIVLEDDLKKQQELSTRKELAAAVAKFSSD
jgi:hypothetical protein